MEHSATSSFVGEFNFYAMPLYSHKIDQIVYAIKGIKIDDDTFNHEDALKEVSTLSSLEHPNIVQYRNCWLEMVSAIQPRRVTILY